MADIVTAQETLTNLESELTKGQEEVAAIVTVLKNTNVESFIVKQLIDRISHQDRVVLRLRILANESIIKSITLHKSNTALKSVLDLKQQQGTNEKNGGADASVFNNTSQPLDEEWNAFRSKRPCDRAAAVVTDKTSHVIRHPPTIAEPHNIPNASPFTPTPPKPFLTPLYNNMNQLTSNLSKPQPPLTSPPTTPPTSTTKPARKITPYNIDQWNRKLAELAKYYKIHGTTDIPLSDDASPSSSSSLPSSSTLELARWIRRQRRDYQLYKKNEPSHLTPERIAALEALKFTWVAKRQPNRKRWMQRYDELLQFKAANGHCDVPSHTKDERYKKLSVWVTQQRTYHRFLRQGKPTMIYADRIKLLDEVGFNWSVAPPQVDWDVRLGQLVSYKEAHGHTNVPQKCTKVPGLGEWVLSQRRLYRHHLAGERKMDPEKIKKLENIGFQWSLRNRRSSGGGGGGGGGKKKERSNAAVVGLTVEESQRSKMATTAKSKTSLPSHQPPLDDDPSHSKKPLLTTMEETALMSADAAAAALDSSRKRSSSSSSSSLPPMTTMPPLLPPVMLSTTTLPSNHHPFPPPYNNTEVESIEMRQTASFLAHIFENNGTVAAAASNNGKERIL